MGVSQEYLDAALEAYRRDPHLAADMVTSARSILGKRASWKARHDIRAAETKARELCAGSDISVCAVAESCGTGRCPWAGVEMKLLTVHPSRVANTRTRPVEAHWDTYNIEPAVKLLTDIRSSQEPR